MNTNIGLTAPPLQSPLLQNDAHPLASDKHTAYAAVPWAAWTNQVYQRLSAAPTLQDTHAARLGYSAERFNNFYYWEANRGYTYSSVIATAAGTVTTAGTAVTLTAGAPFNVNWPGAQISINGVRYVIASVADASHLTLTTTAGAQTGVPYACVATAAGTVDTAGTAVTWKTGVRFALSWAGSQIIIAGVAYVIAAVADTTHLTLKTSAGVHAGSTYNRAGNVWAYASGMMQGAYIAVDQRPADLDPLDAGALFQATDVTTVWRWSGSAWTYYSGQYADVIANRPAALTTNDAGFIFLATDQATIYEWTGAAWVSYGGSKAAADFVPVTDGGASLGSQSPLKRFLNLFLSGQISLGLAGALVANYLADLRGSNSSKPAVLHLESTDSDAGLYLFTVGENAHLTCGVVWNGSAWVAKNTYAAILTLDSAGIKFRADSGLTPGNTYTPTLRWSVDYAGLAACATVNATSSYQANGTAGEASTVITYLTGTPGAGQSSKTVTFKQGIQTAHS